MIVESGEAVDIKVGNAMQLQKALWSILSKKSGKLTEFKEEQFENTPSCKNVTLFGISIEVRPLSENAAETIETTVFGIEIVFNSFRLPKDKTPIFLTL